MLFVVVPAYNEEKKIGRVVRGLFDHGITNVVVVDDGSEDNTARAAAQAGAIVKRHLVNRGQGAALQTGDEFCLARGATVVAHFDGDDQFKPEDILSAAAEMEKSGVDIILGSRFLDDKSKIPFFKKYFILPAARIINHLATGVKLTDAHNGFRVLNRRALEKIKITQDGMAHNSEIITRIKKNNLRFAEFPVTVVYHEYGQGVGGGIKIIRDLIISRFVK